MENPPEARPEASATPVSVDAGGEREVAPENIPSIWELIFFFGLIGLTSFGGGLTAYIRRLAVTQKGWLTDEEFFSALAIVQILPGARVVGISVYIGNHLRGLPGAVVALISIITPPFILVCFLGFLYFHFGENNDSKALLAGVTAVACGLMASMVFEAGQKSIRGIFDVAIILVTFLLVRFGHVHVQYVIMILAPLAIWWHRPSQEKKWASKKENGGAS
jgi:chromate transporter